jgi:hypothetical protein
MAFITSNGLTEEGTSKTIQAGGMTVHYHDLGAGGLLELLQSLTSCRMPLARPRSPLWRRARGGSRPSYSLRKVPITSHLESAGVTRTWSGPLASYAEYVEEK